MLSLPGAFDLACEVKKDLAAWRRRLHKIPETGLGLPETRSFIKQELSALGSRCSFREFEGGIVAELVGPDQAAENVPGFFLRFDMDALPVSEETGLDFSSRHPGMMHACGHDGHAAVGLGLAKILTRYPGLQRGVVRIAFQAAEETLQGAKLLVRDIYSESRLHAPVRYEIALAMHLDPQIPQGVIAFKGGQLNARVDNLKAVVTGKPGHGAYPHLSRDPLVAAAGLIMSVQTIASRNLDPAWPAVLSFCKISGGSAPNVIPQEVVLEGTLRSTGDVTADLVHRRLREISDGIGGAFGVRVDIEIEEKCPAVNCDRSVARWAEEILRLKLGADSIVTPHGILMGGDDFSYFSRIMPALMIRVGVRSEELGYVHSLHSSRFNFNESVLELALGVFLCLVSEVPDITEASFTRKKEG